MATKKSTKGAKKAIKAAPLDLIIPPKPIMWINQHAFLPAAPSLTTLSNTGRAGLCIRSSTTGDSEPSGLRKDVVMGLQVPPGYRLRGVRVCYSLSNPRSFISGIRLSKWRTPPTTAAVIHEDHTHLTSAEPACANSILEGGALADPSSGAIDLSIRVNFGNTADQIYICALGLHLRPIE